MLNLTLVFNVMRPGVVVLLEVAIEPSTVRCRFQILSSEVLHSDFSWWWNSSSYIY